MKKIPHVKLISVIIIGAFIGITFWTAYLVFQHQHVHLYAENSLIENVQIWILAIAGLVYLATAAWEKRSDRLITLFCALLCLTFLLREIDLEDFDLPYALTVMGSGAGRNAILGVAFAAILICAALRRSHYQLAAGEFVRSRPGRLLLAAGVFLLIGKFFDEEMLMVPHHVFFEEISELAGYVLILLSSIAAHSFRSSGINRTL